MSSSQTVHSKVGVVKSRWSCDLVFCRSTAVEQMLEKNYRIHCSLHNTVSQVFKQTTPQPSLKTSPAPCWLLLIRNLFVHLHRKSQLTSTLAKKSRVSFRRQISVRREPGRWTLMTSWCKLTFSTLKRHSL